MRLKAIEMDLPYVKNKERILNIMEQESATFDEATKMDYETSWKERRRNFQIQTRCITSMIERLALPIRTQKCWKVIVECVEGKARHEYLDLTGLYFVQISFDITVFESLDEYEKKKATLSLFEDGIRKLMEQTNEITSDILQVIEKIKILNYANEWYWKTQLKAKILTVQIMIEHNVYDVTIHMIFKDKKGSIISDKILCQELPHERVYSNYLGSLEWDGEYAAKLVSKDKKHEFTASYSESLRG